MPSHPLTNFDIHKYCQNKPKFSSCLSRNSLPKMKDGAYIINFDEYKSIGTHWIANFLKNDVATYFDSFRVENISKEIIIEY